MSITEEQKRDLINAKRGPLENELYAAELDLKVARAGGQPELEKEPGERIARIKDQLAVLQHEEDQLGE